LLTGSSAAVVTAIGPTAFASGFQVGDRIERINDNAVAGANGVVEALKAHAPGDEVRSRVDRNDNPVDLTAKCVDRRAQIQVAAAVYEEIVAGRWASCFDRVRELEALLGASSQTAVMRLSCRQLQDEAAGTQNHTDMEDAALTYDVGQKLVSDWSLAPEGVEHVRALVLAIIAALQQEGFGSFAEDLKTHFDAAAGAPQVRPAVTATSLGSCFFVSPDGLVLTAHHVTENAATIRVFTPKTGQMVASVVADSPSSDLAVLRVETRSASFLSIAPERSVQVGEHVFTMGFPAPGILGTEPKFSEGSIAALSGLGGDAMNLQISIPTQPGNSGGPVVNDRGEVVGIVHAAAAAGPFYAETGSLPQNVNWAVKADYARPLFSPPPGREPTPTREAAIERTRSALCAVEAVRK
jgi:S1-C subfamily serine protease